MSLMTIERNMFVAEKFISSLIKIYGSAIYLQMRYLVSTSLQILETASSLHHFYQNSIIEKERYNT